MGLSNPMNIRSERSTLSTAVVMCTYNGARFVAEQLSTVLAQSQPPDHLIIVDDGSTDATWRILQEECAATVPAGVRLTLRRNESNQGYVANFDYALSLADEDLLFLCDQDDLWSPNKIERMSREFESRPYLDMLHTDARLVDAEGRWLGYGLFEALEITREELGLLHAGDGFEVVLRRSVVTGATAAVRREAARAASPFPKYWVHDEWLAFVCAMTGKIDCLEEPLIDYRQHTANQIGVRRRRLGDRFRSKDSRRELMRRIERRLEAAVHHVAVGQMRVAPEYEAALQDRLLHARVRARLPSEWGARLQVVLREAMRGGYYRFSFGARSMIADLLGLD